MCIGNEGFTYSPGGTKTIVVYDVASDRLTLAYKNTTS